MFKTINIIGIAIFFILGLFSLGFSEESITITTYYPSPYGSYNELRANQMSIGSSYTSSSLSDGNLIVAGNVGIGTAEPGVKLDVAGDARISNGLNVRTSGVAAIDTRSTQPSGTHYGIISSTSGANGVAIRGHSESSDAFSFGVWGSGGSYAGKFDGNVSISGTHPDLAEIFPTSQALEGGDVLVIDSDNSISIKRNTVAYDPKVVGIVSVKPSQVIEGKDTKDLPDDKKVLLALAGRVKCKVTTHGGGPIKRGDLLVTSSKPGYAMRAKPEKIRIGTVLGKALEPLDKGDGKIMVLVTLQ